MGVMSLSSPFRPSHRRTRSHSSPSSSPTPVHRNEQWRTSSTAFKLQQCQTSRGIGSSFAVATHNLANQPPEKWDVDLWRRGKRPRRGPPTSFDSMDLDSCDDAFPGSPESDPLHPIPSSASSAPHFPSTSDAFQLRSSYRGLNRPAEEQNTSAQSQRLSEPELSYLHSQAFDELRRTVAESGEGFVQRMRELEEQRSRANSSRISADSASRNPGAFKRGRKRPSASETRCDNHTSTRNPQAIDVEDDSDVEILSTGALDSSIQWNTSKKRAVSLGGIDNMTQRPIAYPAFKPTRAEQRERSISPVDPLGSCASDESFDEDSDEDDSLTRSPRRRTQSSRINQLQQDSATASVTPPLSFTFSSSANSSLTSLPLAPPISVNAAGMQYPTSRSAPLSPRRSRRKHSYAGGSAPTPTGSKTEKAVAALSLALANGAGSVSDYEALRLAQGALGMSDQDQDAGALWD